MAGMTRIAILFCGQGMATLIEYYKNGNVNGVPDNLVLVDFGGNQKYAEEAGSYVVGKLKLQKKPKFDLVVISHQDGDHNALLSALTVAIEKAGLSLAPPDSTFAGGVAWSAANKKKVESFLAVMSDDDPPAFNAPYESDYTGAKNRSQLRSLASFGSTFIRVVVSGLKLSKAPEDIVRNASSAMIVVDTGSYSMVLPGDATYHTLAEVNGLYKNWGDSPLIPKVFALEIPHHGALRTAVENYSAQTPFSKFDITIITDFASYTKPSHVVASAGPRNTHNHPVYEVIQIFDNKNLADIEMHTYVAYVFIPPKGWGQFDTVKGIRTTVKQIQGSTLWGNLYYDLPEPGLRGRPVPTITFEARGTIEDLIERHGEEAASDPWLKALMASDRSKIAETIFRAPPPEAAPADEP